MRHNVGNLGHDGSSGGAVIKHCPLCGEKAYIKYRDYPGYREPSAYNILHCRGCETSFADPLETDEALYDLIYKSPGDIPGYRNYAGYADGVLSAEDPLGWLADKEDTYWAVREYVDAIPTIRPVKALEVGSGLGYLTYALAKRGLDITGLDISRKAVDSATSKYGMHYMCADVQEFGRLHKGIYDVILMTEVVEHIPDVNQMLEAVDKLLAPGGELLVTTPNRFIHKDSVVWETDLPPVHLWWFSERSMEYLADKLGYSIRFTDFTECNRTHYLWLKTGKGRFIPTNRPVFREDGGLNVGPGACSMTDTAKSRLLPQWMKHRLRRLQLLLAGNTKRRSTLCAIMTKGNN